MIKRFCIAGLLAAAVTSTPAAHIIWVTGNSDGPVLPSPDDVGWTDLLTAAGHTVERRVIWFLDGDDTAFADMTAADLVIVSRDTNHNLLNTTTAEADRWNCITTPMIVQNAYVVREVRWRWTSGNIARVNVGLAMEATEPQHAVFDNVPLDVNNDVFIHDAKVDTVNPSDPGNGILLARAADNLSQWLTYWEPGVEFYDGSGNHAG
ncbi:MAG: hypothetical protein AAF492_05465, partial [Verrucomicrobiota bacterium]